MVVCKLELVGEVAFHTRGLVVEEPPEVCKLELEVGGAPCKPVQEEICILVVLALVCTLGQEETRKLVV